MSPENWPKISLVTPNFNYGHFIEATLSSVLDQRYPNLEYIVLDNASTDGSIEVIRRYADRLAHWESTPNRTQYQTITDGFARATGDIFGWLNSDDLHLPWTLRAVGDIFRRFPEVAWISGLHLGHWDWEGFCTGFFPNRGFARAAFLDGRYLPGEASDPPGAPAASREFIQQESTFWRRELWERAGGYISQEFGSAGDFELWARFYEHADLVGVNIPLAGFRHQQQQQTSRLEAYAAQCVPVLERLRLRVGWRPEKRRVLMQRAAFVQGIGKFAEVALRRFGYEGRRFVRRNVRTPEAHWELEHHQFL
jgi:glycosyltransferase involved in cell wall biosynthesis